MPSGSYTYPAVNDFKSYFVRDFNYSVQLDGTGDATDLERVTDQDITNAQAQTLARINQFNFASQDAFNIGCLLQAAHFLVTALTRGTQGVSGAGGGWLINTSAVGDGSYGQDFPDKIKKSPALAPYLKTAYGTEYLAMVSPGFVGAASAVCGWTKP